MGAYVSIQQCKAFHSVPLNCDVFPPNSTNPDPLFGGISYGEFEPNPDVAGIGILMAFFFVACLAVSTSALYLILQLTKFMEFTGVNTSLHRLQGAINPQDRSPSRTTWADIFEAIILSCSDQQLFTSGAYALTLRYAQGCKISAYHYNIIANMMLITCATHLMSVTVVSQYWKHKLLAVLRVLLITGLYIVTGLLLSNQDAGLALKWPTAVPMRNETDTLLVLPAACFQGDGPTLIKTLNSSFANGGKFLAVNTIGQSSPNNHIVGWNFFILMILWYGAAIIAELFRFCYNRPSRVLNKPRSLRRACGNWVGRVFWFYQFAGATFSTVAIVMSFNYIQDLRSWMDSSRWFHRQPDGTNPENDATSFGQLVPLLLILLTVFTVLQLIGDKISERWQSMRRGTAPDSEASVASDSSSSFKKTLFPDMSKSDSRIFPANPLPPTPPPQEDKAPYRRTSPQPPPKGDSGNFTNNLLPPTPRPEVDGLQYQRMSPLPPRSSVSNSLPRRAT